MFVSKTHTYTHTTCTSGGHKYCRGVCVCVCTHRPGGCGQCDGACRRGLLYLLPLLLVGQLLLDGGARLLLGLQPLLQLHDGLLVLLLGLHRVVEPDGDRPTVNSRKDKTHTHTHRCRFSNTHTYVL